MFAGWDLYDTDPAQHIMTAKIDDLDKDDLDKDRLSRQI